MGENIELKLLKKKERKKTLFCWPGKNKRHKHVYIILEPNENKDKLKFIFNKASILRHFQGPLGSYKREKVEVIRHCHIVFDSKKVMDRIHRAIEFDMH